MVAGMASPQFKARLCGALYVFNIGVGLVTQSSGPETASVDWERSAFSLDLLAILAAVGSNLLFYELFWCVSRPMNRAALAFSLVSNTLEFVNAWFRYVPVFLATAPLDMAQRGALAHLALQLHDVGFGVVLEVFSIACFFSAALICRSTFLPRFLGVLMLIAGVCYFTNSFCLFAAPRLQDALFPYILLPCLLGESTLALWLLIAGVNVERWNQRASAPL
jgi:hypothetical protein